MDEAESSIARGHGKASVGSTKRSRGRSHARGRSSEVPSTPA